MNVDPLELLEAHGRLAEQIAHIRVLDPRGARYADLASALHPRLERALKDAGRERLFAHQAAAADAALRGRDVVVATGTNSGKSLCYQIPALQAVLSEPAARALFLFPTKALAQDQLGKLEELCPGDVRCATYDGDTPTSRRPGIRKSAHIVLSNPDMLHVGILPGHDHWARFLKSLRVIVLDELHVYRGVFGSHVGGILRRLLRLCAEHRATPQILACSATIGNPAELFRELTGRDAVLVDEDGSPQARRTFVFWNPPMLADASRLSPNVVTSELLATLVENGLTTLAFCRARVTAELVLQYARRRLERGSVPPESIESYRAGYTPKERRAIEKAVFSGKIKGLAATNAMELGVDIGGLDAVVLNGYPGTVSSFWQQAGRAGRGTRPGFAVFVAHEDPLEQYLARDPHLLLDAPVESVAADPSNPAILGQQLQCAAYERPLAPPDLPPIARGALEVAESLEASGELVFRGGLFFSPSFEAPASHVDIRGAGGKGVLLIHEGETLGTMERWRALQAAHEGAVYLHRGTPYVVESLDLERGIAEVVQRNVDYYTVSHVQTVLETLVEIEAGPWGRHRGLLGSVRATDTITGFQRKALEGGHLLSAEELDLPPLTFETVGIRIDIPGAALEADVARRACAVHALEHALVAVAPLLAGCDRGDLGSAWYAIHPETMTPAMFVFDHTPGGVGLAEVLWRNRSEWVMAARDLLRTCPCREGCPACLLSARCEAANEMLDKRGGLDLLDELART